jgi:hypothetical protein
LPSISKAYENDNSKEMCCGNGGYWKLRCMTVGDKIAIQQ